MTCCVTGYSLYSHALLSQTQSQIMIALKFSSILDVKKSKQFAMIAKLLALVGLCVVLYFEYINNEITICEKADKKEENIYIIARQ